MKTLVCLLEEESANAMLQIIVPRLNLGVFYQPIVFEGKSDLEKNAARKIGKWRKPDSVFLVLRDQDAADCKDVKENLRRKIDQTGRSESTCIRIACHELESFYLGDLSAVERAIRLRGLASRQLEKRHRSPDDHPNPKAELCRLTHQQYEQVRDSRIIAPELSLDGSNRSRSFNALLDGIRRLVGRHSPP